MGKFKIEGASQSIHRVIHNKNNPYYTNSRIGVDDETISWQATGLLTWMLARPDGWKFYISDLAKRKTDKERCVRNTINELIDAGYVRRFCVRTSDKKRIDHWEYLVFESPELSKNFDAREITDVDLEDDFEQTPEELYNG